MNSMNWSVPFWTVVHNSHAKSATPRLDPLSPWLAEVLDRIRASKILNPPFRISGARCQAEAFILSIGEVRMPEATTNDAKRSVK